jgi:hypothetical protein
MKVYGSILENSDGIVPYVKSIKGFSESIAMYLKDVLMYIKI